jgi:hypothetical protein
LKRIEACSLVYSHIFAIFAGRQNFGLLFAHASATVGTLSPGFFLNQECHIRFPKLTARVSPCAGDGVYDKGAEGKNGVHADDTWADLLTAADPPMRFYNEGFQQSQDSSS